MTAVRSQDDGRPPRVRGTAWIRGANYRQERETPAGAGNSATSIAGVRPVPGDPRGCGEQRAKLLARSWRRGRPPRVRGTGIGAAPERGHLRETPAGAGNRADTLPGWPWRQGDPRGCGEQRSHQQQPRQRHGRPPRVRGTGSPPLPFSRGCRETPAGAGNSCWPCSFPLLHPGDPRGCGVSGDTTNWTGATGRTGRS